MLSKKLEKAMNAQVNAEMWSANLYLSMSVNLAAKGYEGCAAWLKLQSKEEMEHAYMIMDYILKRDGEVKIGQIDAVPTEWETVEEAFKQVYAHEQHVSELIDKLVDVASAEKDKATQDFLWGFVREQVEEEATARGILDKIRIADVHGVVYVDKELGKRA